MDHDIPTESSASTGLTDHISNTAAFAGEGRHAGSIDKTGGSIRPEIEMPRRGRAPGPQRYMDYIYRTSRVIYIGGNPIYGV